MPINQYHIRDICLKNAFLAIFLFSQLLAFSQNDSTQVITLQEKAASFEKSNQLDFIKKKHLILQQK
jgi:hypothetical protein